MATLCSVNKEIILGDFFLYIWLTKYITLVCCQREQNYGKAAHDMDRKINNVGEETR